MYTKLFLFNGDKIIQSRIIKKTQINYYLSNFCYFKKKELQENEIIANISKNLYIIFVLIDQINGKVKQ